MCDGLSITNVYVWICKRLGSYLIWSHKLAYTHKHTHFSGSAVHYDTSPDELMHDQEACAHMCMHVQTRVCVCYLSASYTHLQTVLCVTANVSHNEDC